MNHLVRTALISGGCAAVVALGAVVPAYASTPAPTPKPSHAPATLAQVQAKGAAEIGKRLDALAKATARAKAATGVSDGDRATVLTRFGATTTALTALKAKISADADLATAQADVKSIVTTYRVYAVVLPQARIALSSDRIGTVTVERLQKAHDRLADRPGVDDRKLEQLQKDITAAEHDVSGLSAKALAVTPAQFDADHAVLTPLRDQAADARKAVKDAVSIVKSLRPATRK